MASVVLSAIRFQIRNTWNCRLLVWFGLAFFGGVGVLFFGLVRFMFVYLFGGFLFIILFSISYGLPCQVAAHASYHIVSSISSGTRGFVAACCTNSDILRLMLGIT